MADRVVADGGEIRYGREVKTLHLRGHRVAAVEAVNTMTGESELYECDAVFSTMPMRDLVAAIPSTAEHPSPEARDVAERLAYRDFITVGLLARKLAYPGGLPDTWLYIQDPGVRLGRMQIYNNWSPTMLARSDCIWLGLEYFCAEGDDLWCMDDQALGRYAAAELAKLGLLAMEDLLDTHIIRVRKAYPAYTGVWDRFEVLRGELDRIENLYLIGRNGMHRYNNQDHSMLTAFAAVETLLAGDGDKSRIWGVEPEKEG